MSINYAQFAIDDRRERIVFAGVSMDLDELKNHMGLMTGSEYDAIVDALVDRGYSFDPGFRNLRRTGVGRSPVPNLLPGKTYRGPTKAAPPLGTYRGTDGNFYPLITPFGRIVSVDNGELEVTFDGKGRPEGEVVLSYTMLKEIAVALVQSGIITPPDIASLAEHMGARPRTIKVMPTVDEAFEMVLKSISASSDPATAARDWLTRVTNGVIEVLRKEEERHG